ncbi:MAG: TrmH family RNA methyltransferase, partial [Candidatus Kapaibacterium sp.]
GSEGKGMRPRVRNVCDHLVKIPMVGSTQSLNASVSAGIILFEILRQRDFKKI